jgi:hypothetical protein
VLESHVVVEVLQMAQVPCTGAGVSAHRRSSVGREIHAVRVAERCDVQARSPGPACGSRRRWRRRTGRRRRSRLGWAAEGMRAVQDEGRPGSRGAALTRSRSARRAAPAAVWRSRR